MGTQSTGKKDDANLVFPTALFIKEDPLLFNQWMIENNGLKLLNEDIRVFSPENGNYYLCDYFGGELWLCLADGEEYPFGNSTKLNQPVVQITDDMRRDYGDCFNGCFYLKTN